MHKCNGLLKNYYQSWIINVGYDLKNWEKSNLSDKIVAVVVTGASVVVVL